MGFFFYFAGGVLGCSLGGLLEALMEMDVC